MIINLVGHALLGHACKPCAGADTAPVSAGFPALVKVPSLSKGPLWPLPARPGQTERRQNSFPLGSLCLAPGHSAGYTPPAAALLPTTPFRAVKTSRNFPSASPALPSALPATTTTTTTPPHHHHHQHQAPSPAENRPNPPGAAPRRLLPGAHSPAPEALPRPPHEPPAGAPRGAAAAAAHPPGAPPPPLGW